MALASLLPLGPTVRFVTNSGLRWRMARGWLAVIAIALLLGPASAEAATVSLQHGLLRFEAAPGEQNYVSVAPSPEHNGWLRVSAIPQPAPGPGCERHRFGAPPASPVELIEWSLVDGVRGNLE